MEEVGENLQGGEKKTTFLGRLGGENVRQKAPRGKKLYVRGQRDLEGFWKKKGGATEARGSIRWLGSINQGGL